MSVELSSDLHFSFAQVQISPDIDKHIEVCKTRKRDVAQFVIKFMCQCQPSRCTSGRTISPASVRTAENPSHVLGCFRATFGPTPARSHSNATSKDAPRHSPTRAIFALTYKRTQTRKYVTHNFLIFKIVSFNLPSERDLSFLFLVLTILLLFTAAHMREMWQTFRTEKLSVQARGVVLHEEPNRATSPSEAITKAEEAPSIRGFNGEKLQ